MKLLVIIFFQIKNYRTSLKITNITKPIRVKSINLVYCLLFFEDNPPKNVIKINMKNEYLVVMGKLCNAPLGLFELSVSAIPESSEFIQIFISIHKEIISSKRDEQFVKPDFPTKTTVPLHFKVLLLSRIILYTPLALCKMLMATPTASAPNISHEILFNLNC
jgi:hypothetical protein